MSHGEDCKRINWIECAVTTVMVVVVMHAIAWIF